MRILTPADKRSERPGAEKSWRSEEITSLPSSLDSIYAVLLSVSILLHTRQELPVPEDDVVLLEAGVLNRSEFKSEIPPKARSVVRIQSLVGESS